MGSGPYGPIFTQNTGKVGKYYTIFIFLVILNLTVHKKNRTKILGNGKKYWKSQGNLSVKRFGNHEFIYKERVSLK